MKIKKLKTNDILTTALSNAGYKYLAVGSRKKRVYFFESCPDNNISLSKYASEKGVCFPSEKLELDTTKLTPKTFYLIKGEYYGKRKRINFSLQNLW